jgi:hypothetical protein
VTAQPPPGRSPAPAGAAPYILALLFSPLLLLVWLGGVALIRRYGLRPWVVALASLAGGVVLVVAMGGPVAALQLHFSGVELLLAQFGRPVVHLPFPGSVLWPQIPLSVPVGMLAAAATAHSRALAPYDPAQARRDQRTRARRHRRAHRGASRPQVRARPALARDIGGDLPPGWRHRGDVVIAPRFVRLPRLAVGRPGAGKSVYLLREVFLAALDGVRVVVIDCKGEPGFPAEIVEAYRAGWQLRHSGDFPSMEPSVHVWPDVPLCGWLGEPMDVVNRLLAAWDFTPESDWYREIAAQALALAVMAPGEPISSSVELMRRMDAPTLAALWADDPDAQRQLKAVAKQLDDVITRVGKLMRTLGANLDGPPERAIGRADCTVLSLPVMAASHDAEKILRVVMADLAHYVVRRKPPGERGLVVIDEFSAVPGGREHAIHISERGRSAGIVTVLAVQSARGLGDDQEADRLIGASGTVVLFATAEPERIIRLAGTVAQLDLAAQVELGEFTGRGTVTQRATARVDANVVRALDPGEAFILASGRHELVKIIEAPTPGADPRPRWRQVLLSVHQRASTPPLPPEPKRPPPPPRPELGSRS